MLEALIPSKTRVKLLTLFLLNPESAFFIREISRMTEENMNSVRRELSNLESFGLLIKEKRGIQHYFTVNKNFFLYEDLQRIVLKSEGVAGIIRENLQSLGDIQSAFIYGSFAQGGAGAKSDIDIFIIGVIDEERLITLVSECEEELNREINYTLMLPDEFTRRITFQDPFVKHVMDEKKIILIEEKHV
ncbi:MAG: nucleotidyltransferase domain-containing protein [Methanocalculus sp.]|uniref:nucleotidyltransferase domain-containing protein n=1 Tax=Methanocalculus sp. TaxID=2004547 RepID=UPI0027233EF0|nr:nucleotidyltransferase domain-containing protein [Methanocalculus sp.]MDO9539941.1 nucleotidyltransferase domain-containing protein [Methanocalculus sp.]